MASSEARAERSQVTKDLWIDTNAQRAGAAHAQAFGENIARGLQERLEGLAAEVKSSTRRFTWRSSLPWALGIAIAVPLTVGVCVSAFLPPAAEKAPVVERSSPAGRVG
jgi:hypothetical protein